MVGGGVAFASRVEVVEEVDEQEGGEVERGEGRVEVRVSCDEFGLALGPPTKEVFGRGVVGRQGARAESLGGETLERSIGFGEESLFEGESGWRETVRGGEGVRRRGGARERSEGVVVRWKREWWKEREMQKRGNLWHVAVMVVACGEDA